MAPHRRTVRSIVVRAVVFLLLGAVVNVVVAWAIGLTIDTSMPSAIERHGAGSSSPFSDEDASYWGWIVFRHELPYALRVRSDWTDAGVGGGGSGGWPSGPAEPLIPDWASAYRPDNLKATTSTHDVLMWEYGWPMRSVGGLIHMQQQWQSGSMSTIVEHSCSVTTDASLLTNPNNLWNVRLFAWRPLWPGFMVNTVFFAIALWAMVAIPSALRRRRRIKHGRCPKCAYPIGVSNVCTECGAPVLRDRLRLTRTKQMIIRACSFLVLAALVNLAVAWILAFPAMVPVSVTRIGRFEGQEFNGNDDEYHRWYAQVIEANGKTHVRWLLGIRFSELPDLERDDGWPTDLPTVGPPAWSMINWRRPPWEFGEFQQIIETASGWPMRTVTGFALENGIYAMHCHNALAISLPEYWRDWEQTRMLPLRPIWPGFAINTFFYATILWLLFAFPFTLRRWRRVRRGLCAKCAYPVGASDVCTECGSTIKRRSMGLPPVSKGDSERPAAPAGGEHAI